MLGTLGALGPLGPLGLSVKFKLHVQPLEEKTIIIQLWMPGDILLLIGPGSVM
jgi:hypothetical protein